MFEDLTYEELKRRGNTPLPARVVALLERAGERRRVKAGDKLYEADGAPQFVYCISAHIEVRDFDSVLLGDIGPGEYSGELSVILGQTAIADGVVTQDGEVIVVAGPAIAELIQVDPDVSDVLMAAFAARRLMLTRRQQGTLILVGPQGPASLAKVREYAERNRIPYRELDPADPAHADEIKACAVRGQGPAVVVRGRHVLRDPSVSDVARALGLESVPSAAEPVDLVIAGAGPAGLSAAVYGASEGLCTVLLDDLPGDRRPVGGVVADRKLSGFPHGIVGRGSGLPRGAAGGEVRRTPGGAAPRPGVARKSAREGFFEIELNDGAVLTARTVILATSARYRKLGLDGEDRLQGAGVYYAATEMEARACKDKQVVVVGGGNSAGQAAMFMASRASCVRLICSRRRPRRTPCRSIWSSG